MDHNKNELLGETHPLCNPLVDGFPLSDGIVSMFYYYSIFGLSPDKLNAKWDDLF